MNSIVTYGTFPENMEILQLIVDKEIVLLENGVLYMMGEDLVYLKQS